MLIKYEITKEFVRLLKMCMHEKYSWFNIAEHILSDSGCQCFLLVILIPTILSESARSEWSKSDTGSAVGWECKQAMVRKSLEIFYAIYVHMVYTFTKCAIINKLWILSIKCKQFM